MSWSAQYIIAGAKGGQSHALASSEQHLVESKHILIMLVLLFEANILLLHERRLSPERVISYARAVICASSLKIMRRRAWASSADWTPTSQ